MGLGLCSCDSLRSVHLLRSIADRAGQGRAQGCEPSWVSARPWGPYLLPLGVPAVELLGFGLAHHHRVGSLEVGGVRHQRQGDVPVSHPVDPPVVHAQVVLHVPRTLTGKQGPDPGPHGSPTVLLVLLTPRCWEDGTVAPGRPPRAQGGPGAAGPGSLCRKPGASPRRPPPALSRTDRRSAPAPS